MTCAVFLEYRMNATMVSAPGSAVIRLRAGEKVDPEESGLPKREWPELMPLLRRSPAS